MIAEFMLCEQIVKADEGWRNAMRRRGMSDKDMEMAQVDPFSSGAWFDGFGEHGPLRTDAAPVHRPTSWLLTAGWRRAGGLVRADEEPSGALVSS